MQTSHQQNRTPVGVYCKLLRVSLVGFKCVSSRRMIFAFYERVINFGKVR